jgi:carbonic anhydrase/acetyltransferase-like protein (isoleucine patch superfamily)
MLAAGVPAKEKKELSGSAQAWTETAADDYQEYRRVYSRNVRERLA